MTRPRSLSSRRTSKAFTLVELIVVIAIIIMLAAILVPVATSLIGGKGLRMAKNVLDGYLGGVRLEAVNKGRPVLIVVLPPLSENTKNPNNPWKITVATPDGNTREELLEEGMVAFMLESEVEGQTGPHTRVRYLGRNLLFGAKFARSVTIHPSKAAEWKTSAARLPASVGLNYGDIEAIGIPRTAYMIYVREDGQAVIPADRAGFQVDSLGPKQVDADIVLTDGTQMAFLDIAVSMKVRGRLFTNREVDGNPRYPVVTSP